MKLLLDTHLLIWAASDPEKLTPGTQIMLDDPDSELYFSVVSIWETAIKHALGKLYIKSNPKGFRTKLLATGYTEL